MKSDCHFIKRITHEKIPEGRYPGKWGGYKVRFSVNGVVYEADTDDEIHSLSAYCTVVVAMVNDRQVVTVETFRRARKTVVEA
jgi:hypothetical protein